MIDLDLLLLKLSGRISPDAFDLRDDITAARAQLAALPRRGDVGLAECTRDPIFLLEIRSYEWTAEGMPKEIDYDSDAEGLILLADKEKQLDEVETLSMQEIHKRWPDHCVEQWTCKNHIFLTREEGNTWAEARTYRWPDGWRIWCCCAEGDLAELLKARSLKPTGTLESM